MIPAIVPGMIYWSLFYTCVDQLMYSSILNHEFTSCWENEWVSVNATHGGVPYSECVYPKLCLVSTEHRIGTIGVSDICFSCTMRSSIDEDGFIIGCHNF